jgi:gamma-glutamylaminecyclotransferase
MCLIIHKPKGKKIPSDVIERAKLVNPHGFGITYLDSGKTWKTEDYSKVVKAVDTVRPLVCHFRYATVGSIDLDNVHPFPINESHLIYSNGTVEGFGTKTKSDIAYIASSVLPKLSESDWVPFLSLTETRFCIVGKDGDVQRVGTWINQGGVHYSKGDCFSPTTRVAVYGTLKSGFGNSGLLDDQEFVGQGVTSDYYPLEVEGLPYLHDIKGEGEQVVVEVYDVTSECLQRLDRLEGHPSFYKRQVISISLDDWRKTRAWVYFIQNRGLSPRAELTDSYGVERNPW